MKKVFKVTSKDEGIFSLDNKRDNAMYLKKNGRISEYFLPCIGDGIKGIFEEWTEVEIYQIAKGRICIGKLNFSYGLPVYENEGDTFSLKEIVSYKVPTYSSYVLTWKIYP